MLLNKKNLALEAKAPDTEQSTPLCSLFSSHTRAHTHTYTSDVHQPTGATAAAPLND